MRCSRVLLITRLIKPHLNLMFQNICVRLPRRPVCWSGAAIFENYGAGYCCFIGSFLQFPAVSHFFRAISIIYRRFVYLPSMSVDSAIVEKDAEDVDDDIGSDIESIGIILFFLISTFLSFLSFFLVSFLFHSFLPLWMDGWIS